MNADETEQASVRPAAPALAVGLVVLVLLALMALSSEGDADALVVPLTAGAVALLCSLLGSPRISLTDTTLRRQSWLQGLAGGGLVLPVEDLLRLERADGEVRVVDRTGRSHLLLRGSEAQVLAFEQALIEAIQARRLASSLTATGASLLRCPYCHDDLVEPGETCVGCAASYHGECFAEAGCGTLGCQERRPLVPS